MIIKDQIHGTLEFNDLESRIIDCSDFQRLRRIKQMSVANLVYPGANHTRFEHSLGTAHLSFAICKKLGFDSDTSDRVKLYGLLHDLGHIAFSHEGEDVLKKHLGDHEKIGLEKLCHGELSDLLSENYKKREIFGLSNSPVASIVNSDLGADRMDYLKRDAINTGVAYGIIDIDRLLHTLRFEKSQLCVSRRGLEAAEYLLIARFTMFSTVYLHKTVRIATSMLYRAIKGSLKDRTLTPLDFLHLGDESALLAMSNSPEGGKYASALLNRRLYKEIVSLPVARANSLKMEKFNDELIERFGCDVIVDFQSSPHKTASINVLDSGRLVNISEFSSLIHSLRAAQSERESVIISASPLDVSKLGQKISKYVRSNFPGN
ncbi:HD domain-containing protein [Candidatus Micrarchaeota archaeon]|nr:HD domain-containing protein [Candidatus Micrarchaeota archaeon]